jgi:hypothetical protein
MSKPLRPDDLWAVIEPLLTPESSKPEGRRPRILEACRSHRFSVYSALRHAFEVAAARDGLRFRPDMLATLAGLAERWSVGEAPARTPRPPRRRNAVDFRRAALDSASIAAKGELCHSRQGGHQAPGPHGRERHSTLMLIGANVHDSKMLEEVIDTVPPIQQSVVPTSQTSVKAPRRQGLRSSPLPSRPNPPPHPASHRAKRCREQCPARATGGSSNIPSRGSASVAVSPPARSAEPPPTSLSQPSPQPS